MNRIAVAGILPLMLSCKPDNEIVRQTQLDTFYQSATDMVDILWVIDDSCSMYDEQARLISNLS